MDNTQSPKAGSSPKPMFPEAKKKECMLCKFVLAFSFIALFLVIVLTVILKLQPFDTSARSGVGGSASPMNS